MKLEKRKPSGREKDQAAVKLLEKLREQLHSSNSSTARRAAFTLSWMQEDGLDILKEALYGDTTRRTKGAATYGLRKMRGRMRKIALDALAEGSKHSDRETAHVCGNALAVLKQKSPRKSAPARKKRRAKFEIRDVSARSMPKKRREKIRGPANRYPR
jgi:hypothetical protein